jgi:hypothetical protein
VILLSALGGTILNVYNIIILPPLNSAITYICYGIMCLILAIFTTSIIFSSGYRVKKGKLYLNFGFIKTSFDLKTALNLTYFEEKNMLVLFFNVGEYTRIVIKKEKFNSFSERIREENANVLYSVHKEDKN